MSKKNPAPSVPKKPVPILTCDFERVSPQYWNEYLKSRGH
jgi:hypothetical protein